MVLKGRARYYSGADEVMGEFGPYEGMVTPRGMAYWFESADPNEDLELLQVAAYEKGVNSSNVDDIRATTEDPELQRLFGDGPVGNAADAGAAFGIPADGFFQVIKQVGSYDEIYDNNLNPVGLFREGSLNSLWTEGGLIYAPPFR